MRALVVLLGLVLLAGCMGGSRAAPESAPTPAISLGAVAGRVLDDESVPLAGMPVRLVEAGMNATSGEDGRFWFESVVVGDHTVAVEAVGYEAFAQKVRVVEDETMQVTILLRPVATKKPFVDVLPFEGYIQHGNEYLQVVTDTLGANGCTKCRFYFNASGDVVTLVSEISFRRTVDNPHGPEVLAYALFTQDTGIRYTPPNQYWPSGGKFVIEKRWGEDGARFVHTHGCDDLWFCVDQTFTNYVSLFHVDPAPERYSALST